MPALQRSERRGQFLDVLRQIGVVFVRDRDGDADRQVDIEEGVRLARDGRFAPALVGGVAIEEGDRGVEG